MLRQVLHGLSKRKKKQTNKNTSLKTNTRSKKENWRNFQKSISFWNEKTAAANKQQWRTGGRRARCVSQFFFPSTSSIQTWSESTLDSISLLSESILKLRLEEFAPCESGSGIGSESAYQVDLEADCQVDLRNCAASCPMCELWRFIFRALNWISMWFEFCHYRFQFQHGSLSLSLSLSVLPPHYLIGFSCLKLQTIDCWHSIPHWTESHPIICHRVSLDWIGSNLRRLKSVYWQRQLVSAPLPATFQLNQFNLSQR